MCASAPLVVVTVCCGHSCLLLKACYPPSPSKELFARGTLFVDGCLVTRMVVCCGTEFVPGCLLKRKNKQHRELAIHELQSRHQGQSVVVEHIVVVVVVVRSSAQAGSNFRG